NDPDNKTAAAAGGCVLIRTAALTRIGGIAAIRGKLIDDCSLARAVKESGGRLWLGLADHTISLRGYTTLGPIWGMVARSAYTQLFHSPMLLIGTVIGMLLLYVVPPALTFAWPFDGDALAGLTGTLAWFLMALSYGPVLRYYGRSPIEAFLLPKAGFLYTLMTIDSALLYYLWGGNRWKGRDYGRAGAAGSGAGALDSRAGAPVGRTGTAGRSD